MKKLLALILTMSMLLSCLPLGTLAEGVTIIGSGNSGNEPTLGGEQELKPGDRIKVDGEYSVSFVEAKIFGDNAITDGWHFIYMESKEDGAETVRFDHPVGTHTTGVLKIKLTNRSKENVNWLKSVKCTVVYDDLYSFDTLATQLNPNQTNSKGETGYYSTVAVDTEPLMAADVRFYFSVPYVVRDSSASLIAYVTIGQDAYAVDLRSHMEIDNGE